jgi:putative transposase
MTRLHYDTDLTDVQRALLEKLLPPPKKTGRPPIDNRWIIDAIQYVLRTSCQWRNLPHDFPNWKTVYNNFLKWRDAGTWQRIHDALVLQVREAYGREATPTAAIIDSSSAATTEVGGEQRGYDAGKKVNGRKRHIVVDTLGLILSVVVHAASIQDQDGAKLVLTGITDIYETLKVIFGDSAYKRSGLPAWVEAELGCVLQPVQRPVDVEGSVVLPKRWIVERTCAWLKKYRRHSKDYERNPDSSVAMIYIPMTKNMLNKLENQGTEFRDTP